MTTQSDTPRTDTVENDVLAEWRYCEYSHNAMAELARDFEREAAQLRAELEACRNVQRDTAKAQLSESIRAEKLRADLDRVTRERDEINAGNIMLRVDRDALVNALCSVTRCLEWHEQRHGVGMDKAAILAAHQALKPHRGTA